MSSAYEVPLWMQILRKACADSTIANVGRRLGMSRTTVSLVLSGKYDASTKHISEKVMHILASKDCPIHGHISLEKCQEYKGRAMPTSNPLAIRQWRVCQNCHK